MRALIIGGTRNLGHLLALDLLESGADVAVLNRGVTPSELPSSIHRLRADRQDEGALRVALGAREFDAVIDTTLYTGEDARVIAAMLEGRVGKYVFISTGQVYLVREGAPRPATEEDYPGTLIAEPLPGSSDHENWRYGVEKRDAEDALAKAYRDSRFPFVSLRLPMVNGERDHYDRLRNYLARLDDGGPILVPAEGNLSVRHVYSGDVVRAIRAVLTTPRVEGEAFNISQEETLPLDGVLALVARIAGRPLRVTRVPRAELEARSLLPECSPFSGRWMSALDNRKSVAVLGMRYTPLPEYLERIVADHRGRGSPAPTGYARRQAELELARAGG
ncbi:MAG TPA: NAD-dependent epimerase/dehydratase family protein [Gemmatimonadaceae bacterium]|jgi:nucleoside-diphosphate-sugar epimerase|nr:NAD-dependent epimerase/dehydratase family protein [Gemmatimonadaceae bacterium]